MSQFTIDDIQAIIAALQNGRIDVTRSKILIDDNNKNRLITRDE